MNQGLIKSIEKIITSKKELFIQILFVFFVPIFLLQTGVIRAENRIWILILVVTILTMILVYEKWDSKMLGLSKQNFKKFLPQYFVFTAIGVLFIIYLSEGILNKEEIKNWWNYSHFLYMFFIVSFFQEIAYRGYLIPALGKLTNKNTSTIIFVNALLFTYLHIIFGNLGISLPLAFLAGISFSSMYIKYPNLILIIISHSILNFFAVLYGFFIIPGITF
jgi:membrane protease YdiL (CAAX protease family)